MSDYDDDMSAPENICQYIVRQTKRNTFICGSKHTYGYRYIYYKGEPHVTEPHVELQPVCLKHMKKMGKL